MSGGLATVCRGAANTGPEGRAAVLECKLCKKTFTSSRKLQAHAALGTCGTEAGKPAAADAPPTPEIVVIDPLTLKPVVRPTARQSVPVVRRRLTWRQQKALKTPAARAARLWHEQRAAAAAAREKAVP